MPPKKKSCFHIILKLVQPQIQQKIMLFISL
jgi:hypothetical protein